MAAPINIKSIKLTNITRDPSKLNDKARRFHDPADVRWKGEVLFDRQDYVFVNELRRTLMARLPVKVLVKESLRYRARFLSMLPKQEYIETSGADMDILDVLLQLPINQRLPLETKFTVEEDHLNPPPELGLHCKTVLTERLRPTVKLDYVPFNRRIVVVTLRPGESISGTYVVKNAPANISPTRCNWIKPLDGKGIIIGTVLDENPFDLFDEAFDIMLKTHAVYSKSLTAMKAALKKHRAQH